MIKQATFQSIAESTVNVVIPIYYRDTIDEKITEKLGFQFSRLINRRRGVITKVATRGLYPFPYFVFLGLGERKTITTPIMRGMFGKLFRHLQESAVVLIQKAVLERFGFSEEELAGLLTQSFVLATYEIPHYKFKRQMPKYQISIMADTDVRDAIQKALDYTEPVNYAKDLGNTSRYLMNPAYLEVQARKLARKYKMQMEVLEKPQLEEIQAKALLTQSLGSKHRPKMIVLRYQGNAKGPCTALIGKGLTYDSAKYRGRADHIRNVRFDICGATSVLGVMEIIARRNMKVNVLAVIPATENMITIDNYQEYGVVHTMAGKKIEITYADLEGRLMLCDAITYAGNQGVSRILGLSTITANCLMAMGEIYTGLFCNDDALYQEFVRALEKQDEKCWRLPLDDAFARKIYETKVADVANSSGTSISANIGACLLKQFVPEDVSWMHLDLAQCTMPTQDRPHIQIGATGVMIRSVAQLLEQHALS